MGEHNKKNYMAVEAAVGVATHVVVVVAVVAVVVAVEYGESSCRGISSGGGRSSGSSCGRLKQWL